MPPTPKECPVKECDYKKPAGLPNYDTVYKDIEMHLQYFHMDIRPPPQQPTVGAGPKADKLPRPTIGEGATDSDWVFFSDQWLRYKRSTGLSGQSAVDQLWACLNDTLARAVYDSGENNNSDEGKLMESIKKLAVRAQNKLVNVTNFLGMGQDRDETAGAFTARLKGQGAVCDFVVECSISTCKNKTSYADKMIAHQLVRGLADPEVQEQVLGHAATNTELDLTAISKFIEAKETGKRSTGLISAAAGLNRISDYQRGRSNTLPSRTPPDPPSSPPEGNCGWCGTVGHGRRPSKETREKSCKAFAASCKKCGKTGHFQTCCRTRDNKLNQLTHITGSFCQLSVSTRSGRQVKTLQHHTYDLYKGWVARAPAPHPLAKVEVSLCTSGYLELDLPAPRVTNKTTTRMGMTDTGAQMVVGDMSLVHSLGITRKELIPLANRVNVANDTSLGMIGGILIKLRATDVFGNTTESLQLCYISDTVQSLFLSREACEDLGFITKDFPNTKEASMNSMEQAITRPCQCPDRALPPKPSPPPANIQDTEELKKLVEERYAASAFNQCDHQRLPLMTDSPPLQLHVNSKATPVAVHKAVPVPIHWQQQVKAELDRDIRLGVIEQVPIGEPTTWCSRMVVCPKKDGSPRRTVDLQCLNRAAVRQTHATESPFHQAASIPSGTLKTVLDCWNGYHSIPLAEADRHYTTFTTPWGCYRILVAPQGFLAAGDAYTARFDKIVSEVA